MAVSPSVVVAYHVSTAWATPAAVRCNHCSVIAMSSACGKHHPFRVGSTNRKGSRVPLLHWSHWWFAVCAACIVSRKADRLVRYDTLTPCGASVMVLQAAGHPVGIAAIGTCSGSRVAIGSRLHTMQVEAGRCASM